MAANQRGITLVERVGGAKKVIDCTCFHMNRDLVVQEDNTETKEATVASR